MSNKKEKYNSNGINLPKSSLNSTVNNEETTIIEASSCNNERLYDDFKYSIEVTEIYYNTEDFENIDQLICAKDSVHIDRRIHAQEITTDQDHGSSHSPNVNSFGNGANGASGNGISALQCIKLQPSEDRRLPHDIMKLFPGCRQQKVGHILRKVEGEMDKIWAKVDKKYENDTVTPDIISKKQNDFKTAFKSYLWKEFPTQAKSINSALWILHQSSFGVIICNMKNEILAVLNHHGTWSAIKGHPKIKDDGTLETPFETVFRELFEEVLIKSKRNKRGVTLNKKHMADFLALNKNNFLQCHVDSRPNTNDRSRLTGLFVVRVDEKKWTFTLNDNKENQACKWLNMDDILSKKPEQGRDIYYTLRPFVRYLKDHPTY